MLIRWHPIPGLPGYRASRQGHIRGPRKTLTFFLRRRYWCVKAGGKPRYVHHLVALVFHGPRPAGHEVRHLDGDRFNNHADNLAYGTPDENRMDDYRRKGFTYSVTGKRIQL